MKTTRLEAFSDGVLAIIITIMVLELKVPHAVDLAALKPVLPVLLSYVLSFIYLGIYWNNHHHLFQATEQVSGGILWANLHLLFWLSLFPFATAWIAWIARCSEINLCCDKSNRNCFGDDFLARGGAGNPCGHTQTRDLLEPHPRGSCGYGHYRVLL